jgi:metallopeptidase MepB
MAKSTDTVMSFLDELRDRVLPYRSREINELLDFKKADIGARGLQHDGKLYIWDIAFYSRILREKKYSVDQLEISQYFPLHFTVSAMLKIFGELFGLVFVEVQDVNDRAKISPTGRAVDIVWHEDVLLFSVWNDDTSPDAFVGYLYLDLHPRPGKYGHAAQWGLRPGFRRPDGSRSYPAAAVLANFTKPTAEKPSLLKHHELITLFHEIGHGIHYLVTRTIYSDYHDGVVWDFVEAPSQMLENWCWIPALLQRFSSHYKTGEAISEEIAKRLIRTKYVGNAIDSLQQLKNNYLDMTIHMRHPEDEDINIANYDNETYKELVGVEGPEALGEPRLATIRLNYYHIHSLTAASDWGHGYTTWGHLISGYDAGYYGYLWSEVYATDMFYTVFKKDPMNKEQGMRYRQTVLEKGGSVDPMILLENFLGRKPNTDAFFKELELGTVSQSNEL